MFNPTDILYDSMLNGSINFGDSEVPVQFQVDRKASNCSDPLYEFASGVNCPSASRYLRHAIVTLAMPEAMKSGEIATFELSDAGISPESADTAPVFPQALDLRTELVIDGETWVADLSTVYGVLNSATHDIGTTGSTGGNWLDGALVSERQVHVPFVSAGSVVHDELVAVFGLRHHHTDGSTRYEVIVENNDMSVDMVKSYTYEVAVFVDGVKRYNDLELEHFPHSRWRIDVWDDVRPDLHIRHDAAQMIRTKAVPNYDASLIGNIAASELASYDSFWQKNAPTEVGGMLSFPGKEERCYVSSALNGERSCDGVNYSLEVNTVGPMGVGGLANWFMPATGGRPEIGLFPRWTASWLLSQDYSAYGAMIAAADGSGSWPIHMRDEATGLAATVADHSTKRFGRSISTCSRASDCQRPYSPDTAHQASFSFIPYLITGESYYLEELQFWAGFNTLQSDAGFRARDKGLLERANQVRGAAWALRNLAHTAWATPDEHDLKLGYLEQVKYNLDDYRNVYFSNPDTDNQFGALAFGNNVSSPWMDDYFTMVAGHLVELGFDEARDLARWKGLFPTQRMGFGEGVEGDYCWVFAASYRLLIGPVSEIPLSEDASVSLAPHRRGPETSSPQDVTMFRDIGSVFDFSNKGSNGGIVVPTGEAFETNEACGTAEQFSEQGFTTTIYRYGGTATANYLTQLGPALAVALDNQTDGAASAWERFKSRPVIPNFAENPTWAILPRSIFLAIQPGEEHGECRATYSQ